MQLILSLQLQQLAKQIQKQGGALGGNWSYFSLEIQNMKTLGIVGAGGFFGLSYVSSFLNGKLKPFGIENLVLISRSSSNSLLRTVAKNSEKIQFINGDICNLSVVPICDYWLHFAASSSPQRYRDGAEFEFGNNIKNLQHFTTLVEQSGCVSSILFASSGAVYKPALTALSEISPLIEKTMFIDKNTSYPQSKLQGEEIIQKLSSSKVKVVIARCFTFCGPYLPLKGNFAVGNFISDVIANRPIKVSSSHPVFRSYLHADDLVKWLTVMVSDFRAEGEIFNVGASDGIPIRGIAKKIATHFSLDVLFPNLDSEYNSLSPTTYLPNVTKAARVLGLVQSQSSYDAIIGMAQSALDISSIEEKSVII